jgi:hypothetical protein
LRADNQKYQTVGYVWWVGPPWTPIHIEDAFEIAGT